MADTSVDAMGAPLARFPRGRTLRRRGTGSGGLTSLLARRMVTAVPLLLVVSSFNFLLLSLTPGDAARQMLGSSGTQEQYEALRRQLGLDLPVYEQYGRWLSHVVSGDFGNSITNGTPVLESITSRVPVTMSLVVGSLLVSVLVGVGLGVFSAVRGGVIGRAVDAVALLSWALPVFWVGSVLVVVFAIKLQWFPALGYVPFTESPQDWARSLVLPVAALSLGSVAAVLKQTREAMLDVLGSEYIRMAAANGVSRTSLIYRHALKNAAVPVVTVLGLQTVGLLGGAVLIESVFSVPGLGSLVVGSALAHDIPTVQAVAVFFTVVVIIVNLLVDLAYGLLNPRVSAT
ncbi:ABC transporter permease [Streptomyces sp. B21-097]|uniref:ABC transporter permease n=1 Tax=Streptomyces sp. B21-097 TaxID=3039414 RepID=UPI002FF36003